MPLNFKFATQITVTTHLRFMIRYFQTRFASLLILVLILGTVSPVQAFEGDAYAPALDAPWHETSRESHTASSGLKFSFVHSRLVNFH